MSGLTKFSNQFARVFRTLLPSPFAIAVGLTIITFLSAWIFTKPEDSGVFDYLFDLQLDWERGVWNPGLMVFALQMMLMLVLGHTLALTKSVSSIIDYFTSALCTDAKRAAYFVTLFTVLVSFFNWGLGLIFGAIFARKVGEHARMKGLSLNYAIIGAAGYSGLMVWHGGFSGSSLSKVAEPGHLKSIVQKGQIIESLPDSIAYSETVFSEMNLIVSLVLIIVLPLFMGWLSGKSKDDNVELPVPTLDSEESVASFGAEKMDHKVWLGVAFGLLVLVVCFNKAVNDGFWDLKFITPNWINLMLLGLGLILHGSFNQFIRAVEGAIGGASGILIQFPLYFGIMGIMSSSGMVTMMSDFFVSISNETTFPIFTFFSAGIVNVFVPSGGGQWAVQGPIIIEAASALNVGLPKSILALAYGDQLTNMLQPFWALPLLGITGLRAKQILPYTLLLMLVGGIIFISGLLVF